MSKIKFPKVQVKVIGADGKAFSVNAFSVLEGVCKALCLAGVPEADVLAHVTEAMDRDYNGLLQVTMRTVTIV